MDIKTKDLKIIFLGTSHFASGIIESLAQSRQVELSCIVTQPDRPAGRKQKLIAPEAKKTGEKLGIKIKQFSKINQEAMNFFELEKPDMIIVASYGLIIPKKLIDLPKFECLNVHASLLPELRGPSPIQTAILDGLNKTGVSIMKMDEKIDHGPVLNQKEVKIEDSENYLELENKLIEASNEILLPTIKKRLNGELRAKEQDHHQATFTKIISKKDGRLIWSMSAKEIGNRHRALHLWPKTFCFWEKDGPQIPPSKIIFHEIETRESPGLSQGKKYGEVFKNEKGKICIQTGNGLVLPKKIQLSGKSVLDINDFCNGYPELIGSILS